MFIKKVINNKHKLFITIKYRLYFFCTLFISALKGQLDERIETVISKKNIKKKHV